MERVRRNEKRRIYPHKFAVGQRVLVRQYDPEKQGKFDPLWKGPYRITNRVSETMWGAENVTPKYKGGRKPIDVFHEDQLQPFEL